MNKKIICPYCNQEIKETQLNIKKFLSIANEMDEIYKSDMSWEEKYLKIFSLNISNRIGLLGIEINYSMNNNHNSYEEAVKFYVRAVSKKIKEYLIRLGLLRIERDDIA